MENNLIKIIPADGVFEAEHKSNLLNGVTILISTLPVVVIDEEGRNVCTINKSITVIPYYAWANRGNGEMMIWFPVQVKEVDLLSTDAK